MLRKFLLALVVAVVVTLGCFLLGAILVSVGGPGSVGAVPVVTTIGNFLKSYGALLGVLAGVWYFFTNGTWRL